MELVSFRRAHRDEYLTLDLPESWVGMAEPLPPTPSDVGDEPGIGTGVSPGVAKVQVRVLLDPSPTTSSRARSSCARQPTRAMRRYFLVAAGCVIDIGGALSHGAIVAA